jgi:hypothetical protein
MLSCYIFDFSILLNSYLVVTLASPISIVIIQVRKLRKESKELSQSIILLKQEIKEKAFLKEKRRKERAVFEEEMKQKGLVSFVNRKGRKKWGTPSQVTEWKRKLIMNMRNKLLI